MGCCESLSKILLIIFNVIFFIFGAVILGVGIWVKVDKSNLFEMMRNIKLGDTAAGFNSTNSSVLNIIAIVLIVVGTFTFITGFCGCCGAIKESQCLLYMYSFLVGVVVICEIGIGIYAGVQQKEFTQKIEDSLSVLIAKDFNGILNQTSSEFTKVFTALMFEMKCCGSKGESDFANNTQWKQTIEGKQQKHPVGCCKTKNNFKFDPKETVNYDTIKNGLQDPNCPTADTTQLNTDGCVKSVKGWIESNLAIVIGCCVGLGLFEILCIVFACCVARRDD